MSKLITAQDKRKGTKMIKERNPIAKLDAPVFTFEDAVKVFMNVKKANNLKQKTLKGYEQNLRYFQEWFSERYEGMSLENVSTAILRDYMLWCANEKQYYEGHPFKSEFEKDRQGLSPASVNVRTRVLKVFFNTLHEEEIISRNPAANLKLMKTDEDTVQPLTEDELKKLLAAPDTKYYAQFRDYVIMFLIIDTGMRLNEVCSLEVKDVDFVKRQIVLPAAKNKNRKTRILPLSSETSKLLLQMVTENRGYFETEYVFNTNYGEPVNEKTIQKAFDKYAEKAGIDKRVSPHVLRHNFAKMAALNGMDIFTLMRIMGHADITTTRKYVQIDEDDMREQHTQFSPLKRILKRNT